MRAVLVQAWANARSKRLQAALILVTLASSATLLALGITGQRLVGDSYDGLVRRTGSPHLWLYLDPGVDPDDARTRLAGVPGVAGVGQPLPSLSVSLLGVELPAAGEIVLREWPAASPVGRPLMVSGRPPTPGRADELVVDRNLAEAMSLPVGRAIDVPTPVGPQRFTVVGHSVGAEACPWPLCTPTVIHGAEGSLTALGLLPTPRPDAHLLVVPLRIDRPQDADAMAERAEAALPDGAVRDAQAWTALRRFSRLASGTQAAFLTAFGVVASLAAGLLIATAIGGAVRAETGRIGLLKAVGYTGRQLRLVYLGEYLGLGLVAVAVGLAGAAASATRLLGAVTEQYGSSSLALSPQALAAVPLAVMAAVTVFVLIPVRRAVRLDAVAAIRGGAERPRGRLPRLARLPVPIAHGLADLTAGRGRSALTGVGLLLATGVLVFSIIGGRAMPSFLTDADKGFFGRADLVVTQSGILPYQEGVDLLSSVPGVEKLASDRYAQVLVPGEPIRYLSRVRHGDTERFPYPLIEGSQIGGPGEVVVGYGLARKHGLRVGGTTEFVVEGVARRLRVAGIYRDFNNLGEMLAVHPADVASYGPDVGSYTHLIALAPGADREVVAGAIDALSPGGFGVFPVDDRLLPQAIASITDFISTLALVLALLTGVGVLNSVVLAVNERRRSLGLVKAVGMTPRQVTASVLAGSGALAVAALVVGLPLSLWGSLALFDVITKGIGLGPFAPPVDAGMLLPVVPIVVGLALAGSWLPAWQAGRTDVVAVLRED